MSKTFSLIIFELVPEGLTLALVPNDEISEDQRSILGKAQGKYINSKRDIASVNWVYDALIPDEGLWREYVIHVRNDTFWHSLTKPHTVPLMGVVLETNVTMVYTMGYFI